MIMLLTNMEFSLSPLLVLGDVKVIDCCSLLVVIVEILTLAPYAERLNAGVCVFEHCKLITRSITEWWASNARKDL